MSLVGMVVAFTGKLENKKTALQAQARCHDRAQLVVLVETARSTPASSNL